jgi:ABC-2 type transport system ATP-binding protein
MRRVGAVVEQPKFVPTFTGRKNLTLLARSIGAPHTVVDAAIEQVGLSGRDKERFKGYSLGMKQRLAIAATLLKSPDLLILDEPTNGLDPAGIRDIRDMIRGLGESGVTVLLSSHILAEVQQVCHSVSIIGNGRLLASGDVDDLVGAGAASTTRVRVADQPTAAAHLERAGFTVASNGDGALHVEGATDTEQITRLLAEQGMYVSELTPVRRDLESVFLALTKDSTMDSHLAAVAE